MNLRVLILGSTGIEKGDVLNNLQNYAGGQPGSIDFTHFDLEKDFILRQDDFPIHDYLDSDIRRQRDLWKRGWDAFAKCQETCSSDVFLAMHAVLTRSWFGTRSPVDLPSLISFDPTVIVSLINDVYLCWDKTERRASRGDYVGRPTLEQLLDARRSELLLGDLIANHASAHPMNYLLSVWHPARTLFRLLYVEKPTRVYLSFPISGPRDYAKDGDRSGIEEVNSFLRAYNEIEAKNPQLVAFCPLAIDELPLFASMVESANNDKVEFDLARKWDVEAFWHDELLMIDRGKLPSKISLPREQLKEAEGFVRADVRLRDYRLVTQSHCLAVFNPWFKGKKAKGVRNEIQIAVRLRRPVHIYQDPLHDPNGEAKASLKGDAGALGNEPGAEYITFHDSVAAMLDAIRKFRH